MCVFWWPSTLNLCWLKNTMRNREKICDRHFTNQLKKLAGLALNGERVVIIMNARERFERRNGQETCSVNRSIATWNTFRYFLRSVCPPRTITILTLRTYLLIRVVVSSTQLWSKPIATVLLSLSSCLVYFIGLFSSPALHFCFRLINVFISYLSMQPLAMTASLCLLD